MLITQRQKNNFWKKVSKTGTCWIWIGSIKQKCEPYGIVSFNSKHYTAHRIAYQIVNGSIPKGLCVCHRCDNPICVNPDHLFLGTIGDNNRDRQNKGRTITPDNTGQKNGMSKLTDQDVIHIRQLYMQGYRYVDIAKKFNITPRHTSEIVRGKVWKHIT